MLYSNLNDFALLLALLIDVLEGRLHEDDYIFIISRSRLVLPEA